MKAQTVREQIEPFSRGRLGCSKYGDISDRDDPLGKRALEWPLTMGNMVRRVLPHPVSGFYLFRGHRVRDWPGSFMWLPEAAGTRALIITLFISKSREKGKPTKSSTLVDWEDRWRR